MSNLTDAAQASQDQILAAVRQSQQAVVEAVAAWAKTVENIIPTTPTLPGSDELPNPDAVVDNAFDFASKLLDAQRDFAHSVIAAAAPATTKTQPHNTPS